MIGGVISPNACPATNGVLPAALTPGVYYCSQTDLPGGSLSFPSTFAVGLSISRAAAFDSTVASAPAQSPRRVRSSRTA